MSQVAAPLRCRSFSVPKQGNSREEYEDASSFSLESARFAIADGASESVFAGEWASLLCHSYVTDSLEPSRVLDWRQAMQKRWLETVTRDDLPWYLEEKIQEGAFATFLGLTFGETNGQPGRPWKSLAVGDSCLFQVRGDALVLSFPIERADEFGTRPALIGSRQRADAIPSVAGGNLQPRDVLLLMTDALAEWFLRTYEEGGLPWTELVGLQPSEFPVWVDARRETLAMKNDDVTLLVVELDQTGN